MVSVLLCLIVVASPASASTSLLYKFYETDNPWEDKSSNGLHARSNTVATIDQRGAYCDGSEEIILPPHPESISTITMNSEFRIITWLYPDRDNRIIFWKGYDGDTVVELRMRNNKNFELTVHNDDTNSNWNDNLSEAKAPDNTYSEDKWQLVIATVTDTGSDIQINLYNTVSTPVHTETFTNVNFNEPSDRSHPHYAMKLCNNDGSTEFIGFIYMFQIGDDDAFTLTDYYADCNGEVCTSCDDSYVCQCDSGVGCYCASDQHESGSDCFDCSVISHHCIQCNDDVTCTGCWFTADNTADCTCATGRTVNATSSACECGSHEYYDSSVCHPCSDISDYCVTCSDSGSCTSCIILPDTLSDCSCYTGRYVYNGECRCAPGEFLSGTACASCTTISAYCIACEDSTDCTQCSNTPTTLATCACDTDEYNHLGKCTSCTNISPYCLTCDDTGTCLTSSSSGSDDGSCGADKYNDGSACVACSTLNSYCLTCTDSGVCTSCSNQATTTTDCGCNDNEYILSGTCTNCSNISQYCTSCSNAGVCLTCSNGSAASDCACGTTEFNYNGSCTDCSTVDSYCIECTDQGICTDCSNTPANVATCGCGDNQYRDGTGSCIDCTTISPYCTTCTGSSQCTSCTNSPTTLATCSCAAGEYHYMDSCTSCTQISVKCTDCNDDGTCNVCTGMNTSTSNCQCGVNEYLDGAGDCVSCLTPNCAACNAAGECTQCNNEATLLTDCSCDSDEFLLNGECTLMTLLNPFCDGVDPSTQTCNSCSNSGDSSNNCNCDNTEYLSSAGVCSPCTDFGSNCLTCTEYGYCITCLNDASVFSNCGCLSSQYMTGSGTCADCSTSITYCTACTDASTCTECSNYSIASASVSTCDCDSGHYMLDGVCTSCTIISANCQECTDNGTCTQCDNMAVATAACACGDNEVLSSSGVCEECWTLVPFCITCNSVDVCTECTNGADEVETCTCNGGPCDCEFTYASVINEVCSCPENASLSGSECVCDPGFFASCGDSCTILNFSCVACDLSCLECAGGSSMDCTACTNDEAPDETGSCTGCRDGNIFDGSSCVDCPQTCLACSGDECETCIENSVLVNGLCECDSLSVYSDGICEKQLYLITLEVSPENNLIITFDEALSRPLTEAECDVVFPNDLDFAWELESSTINQALIFLALEEDVTEGEQVQVLFSSTPLSIAGHPTNTTSLTGTLYRWSVEQDSSLNRLGGDIAVYAQIGTVSLVAASIIVGSPSLAWTFISAVQLLGYIPLTGARLPETVSVALLALSDYNLTPNLIKLATSDTGSKPNSEAVDYGYESAYVLINTGKVCTIAGVIGITHAVLGILAVARIPEVSEFCSRQMKFFRYTAYLRLFLLAYLDLAIASLIQATHVRDMQLSDESPFAMINAGVCVLLIVRLIQAFVCGFPIMLAVLLIKYKQVILQDSPLHERWGTLFYEFKQESVVANLYYVVYTLRRLGFAGVLLLRSSGLQMLANMFMAAIVCFSVVTIAPFKLKVHQQVNVLTEGGILIVFSLVACYNYLDNTFLQGLTDVGVVVTVFTVMSTSVGGMAYQLQKSVRYIYRQTQELKEQHEFTSLNQSVVSPASAELLA